MAKKNNFYKQTIAGYLDQLGSSQVSPGGGSAAALAGATGAALVEMTARINAARDLKKTGRVSGASRKNIASACVCRRQFGDLMRLDTEAFLKLSAIPKERRGGKAYAQALRRAAEVPMRISALALKTLQIGAREVSRTSAWLASDLAEAGLLLETAFIAGRLNAQVNFKYIKDKVFVASRVKKLNANQKKVAGLKLALRGALR